MTVALLLAMKPSPPPSGVFPPGWPDPARLARDLPGDAPRLLADLVCDHWERYRSRLRACRGSVDGEEVHDFRVEARRLLALIELLGGLVPARAARGLHRRVKQHLDLFDELRDAQVQWPEAVRLGRSHPAAREFGAYLGRRLERSRRAASRAMRGVRTRRAGKWLDRCAAAARRRRRQGAGGGGREQVAKAFRRSCAAFARRRSEVRAAVPETVHRARVALKRVRYMAEALSALGAPPETSCLEALRRWQAAMGAVQDAELLRREFGHFLRQGRVAAGAGARLASLLGRRLREKSRRCLGELEGADPAAGRGCRGGQR